MVDAENADTSERIGNIHHHIAVLSQRRHQIGERQLQPVHFPVLQGGASRGWVRDYNPLNAV